MAPLRRTPAVAAADGAGDGGVAHRPQAALGRATTMVRMRRTLAAATAAVILALAVWLAPANGAGQLLRNTERASIVAAVAGHAPMARGSVVRLAVEVQMVSGMHVNANPPSQEWMIPVQVSVAGADGIKVVETFYPDAESRKFPYDDEPYLVYEGNFVIGALLALDAGMPPGGHELEVVVDYQACNDVACFAPTTTRLKLPVMVVADAAAARAVSSSLLDRAPFPK